MAGTAAKRPCRLSRPQGHVSTACAGTPHSSQSSAKPTPFLSATHMSSTVRTPSSHTPLRKHFAQALAGLVALRPHLQNAASKIEQSMHTCGPARAHENSLRLCRAWCSSARLGKSPNCQNRLCSHRLARINSLPDHVQPRASARMPRPENALSLLRAHQKAVHSPSHKPKKAGPTGSGASSSSRTAAAPAAALHVHRQVLAQNLTRPGTAGSAAQCRSTAAHCTGCSSCSSGAGLISTAPS